MRWSTVVAFTIGCATLFGCITAQPEATVGLLIILSLLGSIGWTMKNIS